MAIAETYNIQCVSVDSLPGGNHVVVYGHAELPESPSSTLISLAEIGHRVRQAGIVLGNLDTLSNPAELSTTQSNNVSDNSAYQTRSKHATPIRLIVISTTDNQTITHEFFADDIHWCSVNGAGLLFEIHLGGNALDYRWLIGETIRYQKDNSEA